MCTSLAYSDAAGKIYFGRTMELTMELPYQMAFFPVGHAVSSQLEGHPALEFRSKHALLAVSMSARLPTPDSPVGIADLKIVEGLNDAGLTFSLLAYPAAAGGHRSVDMTQAVLGATDLGAWILGQFGTVSQVKEGLSSQPVMIQPLALLANVESPFHYVVHDASGAGLVIEFNRGEMSVYDNPVGVMTNGPDFPWHLTNLNNYTYLSNVDTSLAQFGSYKAVQPDSGIATAGLPSSNTSVGRFVRAVYYAHFTEKAATPDAALSTLAHVMNNFDRPRGASIDLPGEGASHMELPGLQSDTSAAYATEYTSWTGLSDLDRKRFYVRAYNQLNFVTFDLTAFAGLDQPRILPLSHFSASGLDATAALRDAH